MPYSSRHDQARSLKRHQLKDKLIWIPRRCEAQSCTSDPDAPLKKCSGCSCVMYCSPACQKEDWPRHKVECSYLKGLGCWGCVYDPAEQRKRYPTNGRLRNDLEAEEPRQCGICGSQTNALARTECCGNWVCDNEEEYVMFSYSRQFCGRSHRRYTHCGYHFTEGHSGDWRDCKECMNENPNDIWYTTNGYNFTPGQPPPKGYMHTAECSKCKRRLHTGHEGFSCSGDTGFTCSNCAGGPW